MTFVPEYTTTPYMKKMPNIKQYFVLPYYLATISLLKGHKGSFLGWLWLVIKPTVQVGIYAIIFPLIAKFQQDNYAFYLISGILPWTFMNNSIIESSFALISQAEALKRCLLPKSIFPLAIVFKHFILLLISFAAMSIINILFYKGFSWHILLLPLAIMPLLLFTTVISIAIAFLTPYVRDVNDIVNIIFGIMFFFTPIIYPVSALSPNIQKLFVLNPLYWLIKPIQEVVYYNVIPDSFTILVSCHCQPNHRGFFCYI
jgi:lipopolysaccharide transport system permease protein